MNVSALTVANMLGQPDNSVRIGPGPGATQKHAQFSPIHEQPQPLAEAARPTDPVGHRCDIQDRSTSEPRKDIEEVIEERAKSGGYERASQVREPKRQNADSGASGQSGVARPGDAQSPAAVERESELASTTGNPRAYQQPGQPITGAETEKAGARVTETPKSPEIKPSGTTKDSQPGPDAAVASVLNDTTADALAGKAGSAGKLAPPKSQTGNVQTEPKPGEKGQLALTTPVVDPGKTGGARRQHAAASDSPLAARAKPTAISTTVKTNEIAADRSGRTKNPGANPAAANSGRTAPPKTNEGIAGKPAQTQQSYLPRADQVVAASGNGSKNTQKPLQIAEAKPGTAVRHVPTKPVGASDKNAGNPGNNAQNSTSSPGHAQSGTARAGTGGSSESPAGYAADSAKTFLQTPAQTAVAEQAPAFTVQTEPTTASEQPQTTAGDRLGPAGNQVLESVRQSLSQQTGDKVITIQLHPSELGKVSIKFHEQGTEITGTLEVSKARTRTEIEHALPELIRSLADSGVAIRRLDVVLSQNDQTGSQASRDPLLQDGAFGHRDSTNPGQSGQEQQAPQTSYGPTARSRYQYQNPADPHEMLVTNTSINMLV